MILVNKKQLAEHLGVSQAMVTKHVKSGLLDDCYAPNSKKIILKKALDKVKERKAKRAIDYKSKYFDLLKNLDKIADDLKELSKS